MNTFWRVALYEYRRNVFKKSFIFTLLSMPFFIAISVGLGITIENLRSDSAPVGYVDHIGILDNSITAEQLSIEYDKPVEFIAFETEDAAKLALEKEDIQAFYVLPVDYPKTQRVEMMYIDRPGENIDRQFFDFMQINLAAEQPPDVIRRVAAGTSVTVRSLDGKRVIPSGGPPFGVLMPLFITMAFMFMIMMSSGYTMSAVADEKENRTMEVLVTSISPGRLVAGKIVGIIGIGLTLITTWTLVSILGIFVARQFGVEWFNNMNMDWRTTLATLLIAIPSYALAMSLMSAIGAMVTSVQEGQSISAIFFILFAGPLYVSWAFIENPHGTLAITLSLLPFTALVTIGMRNLFTIVPSWQIAVSALVQTLSALGAMWLAGRALRIGMLRYGQRLSLRKLLQTRSD